VNNDLKRMGVHIAKNSIPYHGMIDTDFLVKSSLRELKHKEEGKST